MQIKQVLPIFLLVLFSIPAFQVSGQCLANAEYEVSFEANKGSIEVEFEQNATGVAVEIIDLLNGNNDILATKTLGSVRESEKYELFDNLRESIYALIVTAEECNSPKYGVKVIEVRLKEDE